ncbi:MAG TPA: RES family NAD+ phosphorylase [Longimicrobium sp.]
MPEITQVPDWSRTDALLRPLAYELPQALGELAFQQGLGGLRYPAARATAGVNLVVFTDTLAKLGGSISVTHPFTGTKHTLP